MEKFKVIAFTHKNIGLVNVGKFHIADDMREERLNNLKQSNQLDELMYLSTCNRVEFIFSSTQNISSSFLYNFFKSFDSTWTKEEVKWAVEKAYWVEGDAAFSHLFNVASSLDSLVVGEREIITQVRNAYDESRKHGLTGDTIRLAVKHTVETAKEVYTNTNISRNPISVVSLAFRQLRSKNIAKNARILVVGAGQTNFAMTNFLSKAGYNNFTVFNRTLSTAKNLANKIHGKALPLAELKNYKEGFDILVSCTGADFEVITKEVYQQLLNNEPEEKTIVDLAIPHDFDVDILNHNNATLICVENLDKIAAKNLKEREKEIGSCNSIIDRHLERFKETFKARQVELAMQKIPKLVKEINRKAVNEVFVKELEELDEQSKETLNKILAYVEKKYISVPMKMAKEILLEKAN